MASRLLPAPLALPALPPPTLTGVELPVEPGGWNGGAPAPWLVEEVEGRSRSRSASSREGQSLLDGAVLEDGRVLNAEGVALLSGF